MRFMSPSLEVIENSVEYTRIELNAKRVLEFSSYRDATDDYGYLVCNDWTTSESEPRGSQLDVDISKR